MANWFCLSCKGSLVSGFGMGKRGVYPAQSQDQLLVLALSSSAKMPTAHFNSLCALAQTHFIQTISTQWVSPFWSSRVIHPRGALFSFWAQHHGHQGSGPGHLWGRGSQVHISPHQFQYQEDHHNLCSIYTTCSVLCIMKYLSISFSINVFGVLLM